MTPNRQYRGYPEGSTIDSHTVPGRKVASLASKENSADGGGGNGEDPPVDASDKRGFNVPEDSDGRGVHRGVPLLVGSRKASLTNLLAPSFLSILQAMRRRAAPALEPLATRSPDSEHRSAARTASSPSEPAHATSVVRSRSTKAPVLSTSAAV